MLTCDARAFLTKSRSSVCRHVLSFSFFICISGINVGWGGNGHFESFYRLVSDWYDSLPDSQNGFREAYRTHNNSFILRMAIEKAQSVQESLYVVFIDLKNAFPSTHLPTLWSRLFLAGVSGPLFDWLRMLYARMSYVLRGRRGLTPAFKSMIGVLTGDTAFGTSTLHGLVIGVRGEPIELVSEYKYVGAWFTTAARDIFTQHYHEKASKACRVACASFALDSFMGALPPKEGKMLYMARVDPILTFGCEVVLDMEDALVQKLTDVQHLFIRRLLGLGPRSLLATLLEIYKPC